MGGSGINPDNEHLHYFLSDIPPDLTDYQFIDKPAFRSFLDDLAGFEDEDSY